MRASLLAVAAIALTGLVALRVSADEATPAPERPGDAAETAPSAAPELPPPTDQPAPSPTAASGEEGARSPITVEADSLEMEEDDGARVRATGSVVVEWDTSKLRAQELVVDQRQRRVEATGGVEYESDEIRATASRVVLDVDDETGVLEGVNMHLAGEPGRFGGSRVEKTEGRRVLLDDGYFTTCDIDRGRPPDWELRGKHLDVRFDDYAHMSNARLEIRGVPVFYLPYIVFPTKETRQSGLLPFSLGTSSNRGMLFSLPGYWAIDKHQDLTMTAVIETSARLGIDALYRYAPSQRRWGELQASYYNEEIRGEPNPGSPAVGIPNDRGSVELIHREYGHNWIGYADIQWVGDERFLREINPLHGDAADQNVRRSQRYTASRVGLFASRGFTTAGVEAVAWQDLIGEVVEDADTTAADMSDPVIRDTLHKPINGWLKTDGNLGPVAFAVDSSLASFVRDRGAGGQRLDVASTVALPLLAEGPVLSKAWAKGRASVYAMHERNVLNEDQEFVERLDAFPTRGVFDAGVDTRSKLARDYVFTDTEQWSGLYHSLEPFAALRYTNRSSYDDIPLFDRLDAIDGRDVATYGVDSRFLLRRHPGTDRRGDGPFEFARLSLSQTYNLTSEVVDDHFSDIDLAAFVQPVEGFAIRTLTSYNVGSGEVRGANASVSWETGRVGPILRGPDSQVAAAYRYVRSDNNTTSKIDELESAELLARLAFTQNVALGVKGLYDIAGKSWIEKAVGVTFTASCDCWSVGVGVVERVNPAVSFGVADDGSPDELQVRLAFELRGLGGFGSGITGRTSPALDNVEYDDIGFWRAGW
ncbi:MAG: LPS assembly protein LptD [Candidatus Binatia bacterium]